MLYYLLLFVAVILTTLFYFKFTHKKDQKNLITFKKVLSVVAFALFLFRYLLADLPLENIFALSTDSPFLTNGEALYAIFSTWFSYGAILIVLLSSFFDLKNLKNLVTGWVLPLALLNTIFLKTNVMAISPVTSLQTLTTEGALYSLTVGLVLVYGIIVAKDVIKQKNITKKEIGVFLTSIVGILLVTIPTYFFQATLGSANSTWEVIDLTLQHRLFIYMVFIIPLTIYFIFKNKSPEAIRAALILVSLGGLITFMTQFRFDIIAHPNQWPLHLCNTAMYIIPLCFIFKLEKLFYFTYFINVFGAFIAILMPNYGVRNMFEPRIALFWTNHWWAVFLPVLAVALKMFPRPKLKTFIYSLVGFGAYFLIALTTNAWFSNYGSTDYFFLNSDFIVEKLGLWAENLRNITLAFNIGDLNFVFYPVYQLIFFIVYVIIALGMWFVYEQFYTFSDSLTDMSTKKKQNQKEEEEFIMKRKQKFNGEVVDKKNADKIVFKNFGKRYGNSKELTVKNVNLTINAGEIFGFLGPNGAGKSTLIKSLVGLHEISEGSIQVCGYDVDKQSVETKKVIGFVPDHYALYEKLTGREYINYIADLYEVTKEDRTKRIKKYVTLLNLTHAIDNPINTYSHGMKQKITIISALVHNPKVWILDEPLTGLDPNSIYQIKECMRQHAKEGNIVFFSSHIIDVVEKLCTRIAIIKNGQIAKVATLEEITKGQETLEKFYLNTIGEK